MSNLNPLTSFLKSVQLGARLGPGDAANNRPALMCCGASRAGLVIAEWWPAISQIAQALTRKRFGSTVLAALLAGCAGSRMPVVLANVPDALSGRTCTAEALKAAAAAKPMRRIDPLEAPKAYYEGVYGYSRDPHAPVQLPSGPYWLTQRFEDRGTGLSGIVLLSAEGHALLVLQGMNRWFADRGGMADWAGDMQAVFASPSDRPDRQLAGAQRQYDHLLCDARVHSVEVIGFSVGSQLANYLAATDGAYAVVFGDMGLDEHIAARWQGEALLQQRKLWAERVVSLRLSGDVLVRMMRAGDVIGTVVELPRGPSGFWHQPEIYRDAAASLLALRTAAATHPAEPTRRAALPDVH